MPKDKQQLESCPNAKRNRKEWTAPRMEELGTSLTASGLVNKAKESGAAYRS